jgi:hypothetical protein
MALTYPIPQITTGEYVDVPDWNALVDSINFIANPPACRVYKASSFSHASSGTAQPITFDTERYDTDGMHSTSVNTDRITFTTAGLYLVEGGVQWDANATGVRYLAIRLNGSTIIRLKQDNAVNDLGQIVSTVYKFAAADYVQLMAFQNSGATRTIVAAGNYTPELSATWQGRGT